LRKRGGDLGFRCRFVALRENEVDAQAALDRSGILIQVDGNYGILTATTFSNIFQMLLRLD